MSLCDSIHGSIPLLKELNEALEAKEMKIRLVRFNERSRMCLSWKKCPRIMARSGQVLYVFHGPSPREGRLGPHRAQEEGAHMKPRKGAKNSQERG